MQNKKLRKLDPHLQSSSIDAKMQSHLAKNNETPQKTRNNSKERMRYSTHQRSLSKSQLKKALILKSQENEMEEYIKNMKN